MTPPPEGDREKHVVYEFDLGDYSADCDPCSGREEG